MGKAALKQISVENRSSQLIEFLSKVAKLAKAQNVDHYFRSGLIESNAGLLELGEHFLKIAMGFQNDEFIPFVGNEESPQFVPQSEDYYPWAFYLCPTNVTDLDEVFQRKAIHYLLSDSAGKKNYAVITNLKRVAVYDLKHELPEYTFDLTNLFDALNNRDTDKSTTAALKAWNRFLNEFGPESSKEKKKSRRAEVTKYVEPKDDRVGFVKRFGHMPNFDKPTGWDNKNFQETFKTKDLPFLTTEEFDWDGGVKKLDNRFIWGDNLAVMRSLPSESLDLVYIDPPFFSGRNYNCIFGDDDEIRTFNDIWDGGLPTYLAWLNARLWEIKRLLKPTGNLVVHLDKHACHYVKIELDKIFGPDNFQNEIIWSYRTGGASKRRFGQKHDNIFWYSKDSKKYYYNCIKERIYYEKPFFNPKVDEEGRYYADILPDDTWEVKAVLNISKERIGYPTQKPEELLAKVITALSKPGDTVADFFSGGGTTAAVAEKLGRKWLACDVSRIAISVARDRMLQVYTLEAGVKTVNKKPTVGFSVSNHGAYDKALVRKLESADYIKFILQCYESNPTKKGDYVHGFKAEKAIHVFSPTGKVTVDVIDEFHTELARLKIESGVILAWSWDKEAEKYIDELRDGKNGPEVQLVQVKLVDIESHEFRGDNIRFLNKPAAVIRFKHSKGLSWVFDGTASQGRNDTDIHYYQWDFNFTGRFNPMTKPSFTKDSDNDGNPLNDNKKVEFEFPEGGQYKVALRIIDRSGAEDTHVIDFDTKTAKGKAAA